MTSSARLPALIEETTSSGRQFSVVRSIAQARTSAELATPLPEEAYFGEMDQIGRWKLGLRRRSWASLLHGASLSDQGTVHKFLRQYYPYCVEVMSLIGKIPEATTMMIQLESLIEAKKAPKLHFLVQDILRFHLVWPLPEILVSGISSPEVFRHLGYSVT